MIPSTRRIVVVLEPQCIHRTEPKHSSLFYSRSSPAAIHAHQGHIHQEMVVDKGEGMGAELPNMKPAVRVPDPEPV